MNVDFFLTKNRNESSTFLNHFIKFIVKEYVLCISVFFLHKSFRPNFSTYNNMQKNVVLYNTL
jgi:hypothetical protein